MRMEALQQLHSLVREDFTQFWAAIGYQREFTVRLVSLALNELDDELRKMLTLIIAAIASKTISKSAGEGWLRISIR